MRASIFWLVYLAIECYGTDTSPINSPQPRHHYQGYEADLGTPSICYTYMTTMLVTMSSDPDNEGQRSTAASPSSIFTTNPQYDDSTTSTTTVPPRSVTRPLSVVPSSLCQGIPYSGTGRISSPTRTTVPPSGTAPGTVAVKTPLPTLDCDPYGYLIQDSALYRVDIATGSATLVKGDVGDGRNINAMGYNVGDNFLYAAIGGVPGNLIRISASGDSAIVNSLNLTTAATAGDVDENSQYWVTSNGRQWSQIDLLPGSPTFGTTRDSGTAILPEMTVIDWAYVPGGGNYLYGLGHNALYASTVLMSFDRATHTWSTLTDFGNIAGRNAWGAVYASDDGYLYGSENHSGQIWRFPLPGRGITPVRISDGPQTVNNDGARCIRAENL
ncbi:hypothetical protein F5X99DRAFT_428502 [Biscogniauxia marginata]|nr:hypothetical protein F5X99DRAFT_428502 [Biscogniauxia marginata]